jgi:hypothetical protein
MRSLLNDRAHRKVLRSRTALLINRRIVVVTRNIRLIAVPVRVRAIHPAKARADVHHVKADRVSLLDRSTYLCFLHCRIGELVLLTPVVEPSVPILGDENWSIRLKRLQERNFMRLIPSSKINRSKQPRDRAASSQRAQANYR